VWFLTRRIETGSFLSSGQTIDFRYSRKTDTLWLTVGKKTPARSVDTPIGIVDLDESDRLLGVEILNASKVLDNVDQALDELAAEYPPNTNLADDLLRRAVSGAVSEARDHVKI
jgi:uncharacterized protein YuzE